MSPVRPAALWQGKSTGAEKGPLSPSMWRLRGEYSTSNGSRRLAEGPRSSFSSSSVPSGFCFAPLLCTQNLSGRVPWVSFSAVVFLVRGQRGSVVPYPVRPPFVSSSGAARLQVQPGVGLVGGVQGTPVRRVLLWFGWLVGPVPSSPPPSQSESGPA